MTDYQREKVYKAEQLVRRVLDRSATFPTVEIHGSTVVLEQERRFGSLEAVASYVLAVQSMVWYRDTYPSIKPLVVRQRKGNDKAHYERGTHTIALHDTEQAGKAWSLREIVVLHEMAHAAALGDLHGPEFNGAFLRHVREVIGPVTAFVLQDALLSEGCDIKF